MLLSSSIGPFLKYYSVEEAIDLMSKAGFDAIDFAFFDEKFYGVETDGADFKSYFQTLKAMAEEKGMCFNQAHAPIPSSRPDEDWTARMFENIVRSIRNSSYLGIPHIVVHPVQHISYWKEGSPERLFEMNMDFYGRLKPYSEEYGVKIALENMWHYRSRQITHSVCSRAEEFNKYLDTLNSDCFVGCLDIGHATLVCENAEDMIRKMGKDRLQALHVHDVDGIKDLHTLPYYGITDWDQIAKALKEIGYEGDFTFEVDGFFNPLPKELFAAAAGQMVATGRHIMNKIMN